MGRIYADTLQINVFFGDFWKELLEKTPFGAKLKEKNTSVLFVIQDYPEAYMYVDGDNLIMGIEATHYNPVVTLTLSGETTHKFWLKKIIVPIALAKGEIKAKGPIHKILELVPILKPGHDIYRQYCEKYNIPIS